MSKVYVDRENVNDEQVVILKIYVEDGSIVNKDDLILEYETSKTVVEIISPEDGLVVLKVNEDDEVDVGSLLFTIGEELKENESVSSEPDSEESLGVEKEYVLTKSAVNKLKELGITDYKFNKKFINEEDVVNSYGNEDSSLKDSKKDHLTSKDTFEVSGLNVDLATESFKISPSKRTEIRALSAVQSGGLTSTIFSHVKVRRELESNNSLISNPFLPKLILETALLLKKHPVLNSFFEDNYIKQYQDINIGVAIDLDKGLKVYNIKSVDSLGIDEIESSLSQGIYSYFRNKLRVDEITGSTFTISDLSAFNVDQFIPLVNYRQAAILGISSLDRELNRFNLSLSFDHRILEGKQAAVFLSELVKEIEEFSK